MPILSNLYHIFKADKIIFLAFHKLSLQFGPVYTLFLGPKKHVVVSGVSELKELMHNPAFDDRTWPSNKRIVDEIYSGQTKKENPSKQTEHHLILKIGWITDSHARLTRPRLVLLIGKIKEISRAYFILVIDMFFFR